MSIRHRLLAAVRQTRCRLLILAALCGVLDGGLFGGSTPRVLTLQISNDTAPAGGWTQIKISLTAPHPVAAGKLVMDLDPSVFASIGSISVFSAEGDAYGMAAFWKSR